MVYELIDRATVERERGAVERRKRSVKEREVKERGTREAANKNYKQENRTKLGYLRNNRRTTR